MNRKWIRKLAPGWALNFYRALWNRRNNERALSLMNPTERRLHLASRPELYSDVQLGDIEQSARSAVRGAAESIYGARWNYYSDALRVEIVRGFFASLNAFPAGDGGLDYLEIGSCQGLSMSVVGLLLRGSGRLGTLTSIDPYFEGGYIEGEHGPYLNPLQVAVNKTTRDSACRLYRTLELEVELRETTSLNGLVALIAEGRKFDVVYIDGAHEALWPVVDFGLSVAVLRENGVIILDDHMWPDVEPLKTLCDQYATKVQETWKTASYRVCL
jgi:hypothetical protein